MYKICLLCLLFLSTTLLGRSDSVVLVYKGYAKVLAKGYGFEDAFKQNFYLILDLTNQGDLNSAHIIEYGKFEGEVYISDPGEIPFTKNVIDLNKGNKNLNLVASFSGEESLMLFLEGRLRPRVKTGLNSSGTQYSDFVAPSIKGQMISYSSEHSYLSQWNLRLDGKMTYEANNASKSIFSNTSGLPDLNNIFSYLYYVKLRKYIPKQALHNQESSGDIVIVNGDGGIVYSDNGGDDLITISTSDKSLIGIDQAGSLDQNEASGVSRVMVIQKSGSITDQSVVQVKNKFTE